jgi:hypothetical protein
MTPAPLSLYAAPPIRYGQPPVTLHFSVLGGGLVGHPAQRDRVFFDQAFDGRILARLVVIVEKVGAGGHVFVMVMEQSAALRSLGRGPLL